MSYPRKIIAALQTSVDSFIEGPNGELDWAMAEDEETWRDVFEMLESVDSCILGRGMYPDYEQYWLAVLANPTGILPLSGRPLQKMKSLMHAGPIRHPISFFPERWTRWNGRQRGSYEMWRKFEN
jgi:hypothetical protein